MKLFKPLYFLCILCAAHLMIAQQVAQDPAALDLLHKAVTAAGGIEAVRAINDFHATGAVTHYWAGKEVSGGVEIRARGRDQVRMDSHVEGGMHSIVLNHGAGQVSTPAGSREISATNRANMGLLVFALPSIVSALDDPTAALTMGGIEQINGVQAQKIEIVRGLSPRLLQDEKIRNFKKLEVFIDPGSLMIVAIRHLYFRNNSSARGVAREVDFSDFKRVQGIAIPQSITEKNFDQPTWTVKLATIEFNVGVQESEFSH